jgi:hypothetical protein
LRHASKGERQDIFEIASTQLAVDKSKTIMAKTIKEAYHSYLFILVFETNRFALYSLASHRMTDQVRIKNKLR